MVRGEVHLVRFDPTAGSEIRKTRRVSWCRPTNSTHTSAPPLLHRERPVARHILGQWPAGFGGVPALWSLDQLRTVDTERLVRRLGRLSPDTVSAVLGGLQEMVVE